MDVSIHLDAPSDPGTYYYGACVDEVRGESNTDNNCSKAVRVVVSTNFQGITHDSDNDKFYVLHSNAPRAWRQGL